MTIETVSGIYYSKPKVILLQDTGLGTAEFAARSCYDSFSTSENASIKNLDRILRNGTDIDSIILNTATKDINTIQHSQLLDDLAWTHFHHSILEHTSLTYLIRGTSRGVLQEHARHRLQSISVRSTRYTMTPIINAFVAEQLCNNGNTIPSSWFIDTILALDIFVTTDRQYNILQIHDIYTKLVYQWNTLGSDTFLSTAIAKSSLPIVATTHGTIYEHLQNGKKKRNIGDSFKHIVNDNWKVDMVVTMNLRALKNYFTLRDSGSAYFQIQWLAQAMKEVTPLKYLDLIIRNSRDNA